MRTQTKMHLPPPKKILTKSNLFFTERTDVRWGDVSQIKVEMNLFKAASKQRYTYYHLLSGQDLPLHSQGYIHKFFDGKDCEFIGIGGLDVTERIYAYNLFTKHLRMSPHILGKVIFKIQHYVSIAQLALGIRNKILKMKYVAGSNWCSVTHDFVTALLKEEESILHNYRFSLCADEVYKQTFAYNSSFKEKLFDINDQWHGCLREIDWKRGNPYIWRKEDFPILAKSTNFFARKFDSRIDNEIIDMIIDKIHKEQET